MATKKILFTMTPKPYRPLVDYAHPFDLFGGRLSAFQGLFTMHSLNRPVALHLLAQNVPFPSKVLEVPSVEELKAEIREGYEYIAIQVHSNMEFPAAMEICKWIRELSPSTQIILGGHGVTCYTEEFITREEIESLADHVCWGEGVEFIRNLFGSRESVDPVLPPMQFFLEMMPDKVNHAGVIVPGVGCTNRCSFCATGHFFGGRFIPLQTAAGMYRVMERTQETYRSVDRFALFDELFLSHADQVKDLGERIYHGSRTNLSTVGYFTFSDFRSLLQYDPDDLVRWGVSRVFLGVESTVRPLAKTRGIDLKAMVESLHSRGIETILSMIFGMAHHTRDNIQTEMENFLGLGGVYNQITIESPPVGTPNWKAFKLQGRIDDTFKIEDLHGYSKAYSHPNFVKGEVLEIAKGFQKRIYREKGPGILKAIEVELNGLEYCLAHEDPILRTHKASYFARSLRNQAPILHVIQERSEHEVVRRQAEGVLARYLSHFEAEDTHFLKKGERLLRRYDKEAAKRAESGSPVSPYFSMDTIETCYGGLPQTEGEPVTLELAGACA
jgi:hypothetical protein